MFFAYGTPAFVITMFVIYKLMDFEKNLISIIYDISKLILLFVLIIGFCVLCFVKIKFLYPYLISWFILTLLFVYCNKIKLNKKLKSNIDLFVFVMNIILFSKIISVIIHPKEILGYVLTAIGGFLFGTLFLLILSNLIGKIFKIKVVL